MNKDKDPDRNTSNISACMIVRDEEEFLVNCLESIQEYVDEIIIVDTGSKDRTVEIAESFGARIYHHPWEDHFSKHRNQSFDYAEKEWILYIDADEELLPGSGETLLKSIKDAADDVDAIAVTLECIFDEGKSMAYNNAVRLFRNHRGFYYKGRVHNYIVGVKNILCAPVRLFHYGYNIDQTGRTKKFERTTKLLKMDIADDPNDPRPHHFLGTSYLSENMYEEALKEAGLSIELSEKKQALSHNYFWSLYIAATASLNLGKIQEAKKFANKGISLFPNHLDSHYILSLVAYENHDRKAFEKHFEDFARIKKIFHRSPEQFGEMVHNSLGSQWMLQLLKGFLFLDGGMNKQGLREIESARKISPDPGQVEIRLGNFYLNRERYFDAEKCFLNAAEKKNDDPILKKTLAFIYEKTDRYDNQAMQLELALKIRPDDIDSLFAIGVCRMKLRDFKKAEKSFEKIIALENSNIRAIINRAICLNELENYKETIALLQNIHCENRELKSICLSNLAIAFFRNNNVEKAAETYYELDRYDPTSLFPPVFLSRIFLDQMDLEGCAMECGKLMVRLGIKEGLQVDKVEDLAHLYLRAVKFLPVSNDKRTLARECLEISLALSNNNPQLLSDIGSLLVNIGEKKFGIEILKKALIMSPSDQKIKEAISNIITAHPAN